MIWHWEISHKSYVCVFTSCSVKLPVVDDVITFLLILSKANVATADAFCRNKFEISMITFCSCKRTIHFPTKEYHLVEEDHLVEEYHLVESHLLVAFNWWCLPTDVSLSKHYLNYRDVYLFGCLLGIGDQRILCLLRRILHLMLGGLWLVFIWREASFKIFSSPVALHLSPATSIFKENPASWRSMPSTGTWEKRCPSSKCN